MRDINKIIAELALHMMALNAEEINIKAQLKTNQVLVGKLELKNKGQN